MKNKKKIDRQIILSAIAIIANVCLTMFANKVSPKYLYIYGFIIIILIVLILIFPFFIRKIKVNFLYGNIIKETDNIIYEMENEVVPRIDSIVNLKKNYDNESDGYMKEYLKGKINFLTIQVINFLDSWESNCDFCRKNQDVLDSIRNMLDNIKKSF